MKNRYTIFSISGFLFTAGAALIALQQSGKVAGYDSHLLLGGAIVVLAAVGALIVAASKLAYPSITDLVFYLRGEVTYVTEQASIGDLDCLFGHYEKIFGNDLIPQEEFTKWMTKNPNICQKVVCLKTHKDKSKKRVAGFFDFEPLTSHAYKRLLKGVVDGWGLSSKDILSPRTKPKSFYIGSIGTTSKSVKDRGATLLAALEYVRNINSRHPITLLTNPITADGLRLCEGFGFIPVNEEKPRGVWKLEMPINAQIPRYERKLFKAIYAKK